MTGGADTPMHEWLGRMSRRFPPARSPGVAPDGHDASVREDSTREELKTEAGTLARQFRDEFASLQLAGVPPRELADLRNRFNTFFGRVGTDSSEQELRRVITDLRAVLRDAQDRNRELPDAGLDGDVDIVEDLEVDQEGTSAGARDDATTDELLEELRGVDRRAHALFRALRDRIPARDRDAFAARQHLMAEILGGRASIEPAELRRAITDAYDLLSDLQAREREVRDGAPAPGARGAVPNDLRRLYALAERRIGQLRSVLRDAPTEVDPYVRQLNSLVPRIRSQDEDELERCAVDLRGFLEDVERRLRAEVRRRRGG